MSSSTRWAEAIHSATRTELSMNQLKAICTDRKAAASCMTAPSVSAPERYLGATSTSGMSGTSAPLALCTVAITPLLWI